MSEFTNVILGNHAQSLDVTPAFDTYTGVEIAVDDDTAYFSGNENGRVLHVDNPWGTQVQADRVLRSLSGFMYQPYSATGTLLDPAAELGDGVTVNDMYSGIYKVSKYFGPMMLSDIEAPHDEEIDHEYHYESPVTRSYRRAIEGTKAQISLTQDDIAAEVERATAAEGTLSSALRLTADAISAKVSASNTNSSFGWELKSDSWTLNSNGSTVFKATSEGIEVRGKITATSGFIGNGQNGFAISATAISKGMTSIDDTEHNGVYIGTNGIALGKGNFRVNSAGSVTAKNLAISGGSIKIGDNFKVTTNGNVTANNMTLKGKLYFASKSGDETNTIDAEDLYTGAWDSFINGDTWTIGAGWGSFFGDAISYGSGHYPDFFRAGVIYASNALQTNSLQVGSATAQWMSRYVKDSNDNTIIIRYLGTA